MKITIEADNDEELEGLPEPIVFDEVIEFAVIGRKIENLILTHFNHMYCPDSLVIVGMLQELKYRLLDYGKSSD